ncbi:MAG: hypothetical protein FJW23_08510 [Acidimicrobiia bacterium]|nr:hypothetical protein [Acidimicrobiia bacterium]
MLCPLCNQRKARRTCPALDRAICSVCCGTKRQVEIACPPDCVYLTSSREHPAAVVRRRQEQDVRAILPFIRQLTERQYQLFFVLHSAITRYQPSGVQRLTDTDVAEAAGSMAASIETAARGVLYEHTPQSPIARRLVEEMKQVLDAVEKEVGRSMQLETAVVLRSIERGAREAGATAGAGGSDTAYLQIMGRLLGEARARRPEEEAAADGPRIILP